MHLVSPDDKTSSIEQRRLKEVGHIRNLLTLKKLTLAKIDQEYNLPRGTAGNAVHEPHLAGERAIAAGFATHIAKPVDTRRLAKAILEALR